MVSGLWVCPKADLVILAQLPLGDGERGQHLLDQTREVLARIPAHTREEVTNCASKHWV